MDYHQQQSAGVCVGRREEGGRRGQNRKEGKGVELGGGGGGGGG